jgi:hypothetical protein
LSPTFTPLLFLPDLVKGKYKTPLRRGFFMHGNMTTEIEIC